MACTLQTLSGSKIEVGTAVAVADCTTKLVATDYDGVADWTVVGGIETGGFSDQEWSQIDMKLLAGGDAAMKGGFSNGSLNADIAWETTDGGMVMLEGAYASSTTELAVKVTYPNGKIYFAQGLVMKLTLPTGGQDDIMMRSLGIALNQAPVTA